VRELRSLLDPHLALEEADISPFMRDAKAFLIAKLPEARAAFTARCERVWGPLRPLASRTPIPE
jgi:hypothetical protein